MFVDLNANLAISPPFFSPNSETLGVVSQDGRISLLDGKTGSKRLTLEAMFEINPNGAFSRDGDSLIVGAEKVRVLNAVSPERLSRMLPRVREELQQLDAAR